MTALSIEFVSQRHLDGYRVAGDRIVPIGSRREDVRPLAFHAQLYLQFARLDDRPESFAEFISLFGPLTHDGNYGGESIETLKEQRFELARLVEFAERDPKLLLQQDALSPDHQRAIGAFWGRVIEKAQGSKPPASTRRWNAVAAINAVLRPGAPDGRPSLCLVPDTLWDAMLLQFFQTVSAGASLKACAHCGQWFEAGGPTGRRADARYCSDRCRIEANLEKAKNGAPRKPVRKARKGRPSK